MFDELCYDENVLKHQAVRHGRAFVKHVFPAVMKPARTLWNEVIGFIFLCFGGIFGIQVIRYSSHQDWPRAAIAGFCTLLFVWYGVSSFRRARKIARS